jgi:hypothetical protein
MMNTVSQWPTFVWQPLKRTMVENLNKKKIPQFYRFWPKEITRNSDIITASIVL